MSVEEIFKRNKIERSDIAEWKRFGNRESPLIKTWKKRLGEIGVKP